MSRIFTELLYAGLNGLVGAGVYILVCNLKVQPLDLDFVDIIFWLCVAMRLVNTFIGWVDK